ncbi:MAG: DUF4926 domain-containing protein [Candidatus Thiodiazotropha taylori]|nr:DUF4926 domain-containing protein [Candidatus Thiodiazotropha taylori]
MIFEINDAVVLKADMPEEGLKAGTVGDIVADFTEPNEAYEVEFCDDEGDMLAQLALLPGQLSKLVQ